tara:strand:- start:2115 stop:2558 length:444 start_codon:yes stop_codon:yes gene_type:complete
MKYHHVKIKVMPHGEKEKALELLVMAETFTDCESIANVYIGEQFNEFKITDIKDAKVSRVIDNGENEKYVMVTASWISIDDKPVKENVIVIADSVQESIIIFDKQSSGMINNPVVDSVKTTKIIDRIDNESQSEMFKQFEVKKSTEE